MSGDWRAAAVWSVTCPGQSHCPEDRDTAVPALETAAPGEAAQTGGDSVERHYLKCLNRLAVQLISSGDPTLFRASLAQTRLI